ncbi:Hypothetical protein NTJ_08221 [Nesidiocoris tenuis]|uniref:Uncharacterized protein n=1 Tax=Nesidiocoris tenuis TaxID=355587 RepID=A0ABN7AT91_9HEMI|nr:Hypothetical protein NTJ_08221 [Nesidiocoris tenuis]
MASAKFFLAAFLALVVVAQVFAFPGEGEGPIGQRQKKDVLLGYGGYGYSSYYPSYYGRSIGYTYPYYY